MSLTDAPTAVIELPTIPTKLGEILVARGWAQPDRIERALEIQAEKGGRIGEILLDLEAITPTHLTRALAEQVEPGRTALGLYRNNRELLILHLRTALASRAALQLHEGSIRRSHPAARDIREAVRHDILIGALRILWRDSKPAIALVKIAAPGHIGIVLGELAIVTAAWPARTGTAFDYVAAFQLLHAGFLGRIAVTVGPVNRKSIGCIADQRRST